MHLVSGQGVQPGRTFMPGQEMSRHLRMKVQTLRAIVTDAAAVTAAAAVAAAYIATRRPAAAGGLSSTHGSPQRWGHHLSYLKGTVQRGCWSNVLDLGCRLCVCMLAS